MMLADLHTHTNTSHGHHSYGSELRLDFVARLRDEKRFDSADALVAQIRTDVARARDLLTMYF